MTESQYTSLYGPTVGDSIRLGDTNLFAKVEKDYANYGDEVAFGGGKSIRDGMGQNPNATRDDKRVADLVITNAVIIDHDKVVKGDIGVKNGYIMKIGKAGNPDIMDDVDIIIGASTEIIAAEGNIITAGGIDTHVHFINPEQAEIALESGITTQIGGGQVRLKVQKRRQLHRDHGTFTACFKQLKHYQSILVLQGKAKRLTIPHSSNKFMQVSLA